MKRPMCETPIGEIVYRRRKKNGQSRSVLGQLIGRANGNLILDVEKGCRNFPNAEDAYNTAVALGFSYEERRCFVVAYQRSKRSAISHEISSKLGFDAQAVSDFMRQAENRCHSCRYHYSKEPISP